MLKQDKLDVKIKQRSNIFNWRGQFTPELVEYLLDEFATPNDVILDPFSGSGTVLQEALKKDLSAYGFEINPAAYAMSKFFTFANIKSEERQQQLKILDMTERSFCNKFANNIIEDILVFKKNGHHEINNEARIIAENSLKKALDYAESDVKADIIEAIDEIHSIPHSPLFQAKDLMEHERITA